MPIIPSIKLHFIVSFVCLHFVKNFLHISVQLSLLEFWLRLCSHPRLYKFVEHMCPLYSPYRAPANELRSWCNKSSNNFLISQASKWGLRGRALYKVISSFARQCQVSLSLSASNSTPLLDYASAQSLKSIDSCACVREREGKSFSRFVEKSMQSRQLNFLSYGKLSLTPFWHWHMAAIA